MLDLRDSVRALLQVGSKCREPFGVWNDGDVEDMTEHIKYVDREMFMLAWGSEGSGVMFGAEQWHMLTEEDGQTKYEVVAVMKGLVAHGVKRVMKQTARDLESSIQDMATSLQRVCE